MTLWTRAVFGWWLLSPFPSSSNWVVPQDRDVPVLSRSGGLFIRGLCVSASNVGVWQASSIEQRNFGGEEKRFWYLVCLAHLSGFWLLLPF
jgi:hypothetical protein